MKRIPFGQEKLMTQLSTTCTGCGVPIGSLHAVGCEAEQCPVCGRALIYCRCGCGLSPHDEFIHTAIMSTQFEGRSHANDFRPCKEDIKHPSLIENAASLRVVFDRPCFIEHGVAPIGWDGNGEPVFSDDDLKRALLLSEPQLEFIQELRLERQPSPSGCWC